MLQISPLTHKFLLKEYRQKHRHYHNYAHICHVLDTIHDHSDKFSNIQAAELAANFHDVVYEVGDKYDYNEQRSCIVFLEKIEEDNPNIKYDRNDHDFMTVELALIMIGCTHGHTLDRIRNYEQLTPEQIEDIKMFLDADIKILAESEDKVLQFESDIRKEFSIYSDVDYTLGRIKVLESFLNRRQIYLSEIGKPWEQKARKNLHFLIDVLKS